MFDEITNSLLEKPQKYDYIDLLGLGEITARLDTNDISIFNLEHITLINNNSSKVNVSFIKRGLDNLSSLVKLWSNTSQVLIFQSEINTDLLRENSGSKIIASVTNLLGEKSIKYLILQEEKSLTVYFFKDKKLYERIKNVKKVTAVLPAYNEEKTIGGVIHSLLDSEFVDELIVVDDGSTDNTLHIIKTFSHPKLKIITIAPNRGKGHAVSQGIKQASGEIICMVDADLENVKNDHINILTAPLILSRTGLKGVLGMRLSGNINISKMLTGERSYFKKDLEKLIPVIEQTKYGIETVINYHYRKEKTLIVAIADIKHYMKTEKNFSLEEIIQSYTKEAIEIAYYTARLRMDNQSQQLTRLINLRKLDYPGKKVLENSLFKFSDPQIKYIFNEYLKRIESINNEYKKSYRTIKKRVSKE